jgi:hypothetical protein
MRTISLLAGVLCTIATASAQRSEYHVYPDLFDASTSFVSRGALGANPGELLAELPGGLISGIGQDGSGACLVNTLVVTLQDQDASTPETWGVVGRPRAASGTGPDTTAAPLYAATGFQTPPGVGVTAWAFTLTFRAPAALPCSSDYFHGVILPAGPNWPATDGLSAAAAHYSAGGFGDHPRPGAPNLGWTHDPNAGFVQAQSQVWSFRLGSATPSLQMGNDDPASTRVNPAASQGTANFGAGGFFPQTDGLPRADGIDARIYDSGNAGGTAFLFLSFSPAPVPLAIAQGDLLIDPAFLLPVGQGTIAAAAPEVAIFPMLPPGTVPHAVVVGQSVWFQAVTADANLRNLAFSNAAAMSF